MPAMATSPNPSSTYRGVSPRRLLYCIAVIRLGLLTSNLYSFGEISNSLLILVMCLIVNMICPACFSLCSLVVPIAMALHALFIHENATISIWQLIFLLPITLVFIGIPMSICLHRYFSHQAFATSRAMQCVLAVVSTLAFQGGPLLWAVLHTRHHKNCDQKDDPHSILQDGFWYSFLGWTMNPINYEIDMTTLSSAVSTPETRFVQKIHVVFPTLLCLSVHHSVGYTSMLWSVLIPMLLCRLITYLFNLEFHPVNADAKHCKSIDDTRILAKIVGESCHDDHHKNPRRCRRPDWDLAHCATISWMQPLGLVWDCREVSPR